MGAPRTVKIDWGDFRKLCEMHCTKEEVCAWFNCSAPTLDDRIKEEYDCTFSEIWDKYSQKGKMSLRRKQWEKALAGDGTMLVWLGKQYLGQKNQHEVSGPGGGPIRTVKYDMSAKDAAKSYAQLVKGEK